ncbi:MAG: NBR1-Ig-like domain-containing protein [Anaerolineales bacterium]|nr:NBR1-Ig-like domain-containing protein [Anaerolineales bacterium]
MRHTRVHSIVGWLSLLFFILACGFPARSGAPSVPEPQSFVSLDTAIVETAAAAQTQTAAILPTATLTPTVTFTATITPTPTPTFVFLLPTFTPFPTGTPPGSIALGPLSNATSGTPEKSIFTGHPWSCRITGKQPDDGTVFKPGTSFTVGWKVFNTGDKTWTVNTIDFVYTGGYRHEGTKIQDFRTNVPRGGTGTVSATFVAPKAPGEYNSFFTLKVGNREFCGMRIIFEVQK